MTTYTKIFIGAVLASAPATPPREPEHPRVEASSAEHSGFRYRGTSFGMGAKLYTYAFWRGQAGVGPYVDALSEFGTPKVRLAVRINSVPWNYSRSHSLYWEFISVGAGLLAGNHRLRGGFIGYTGFLGFYGVDAVLLATPWRDRRGNRHGLHFSVGYGFHQYPVTAVVGYRIAPRAINMVRRRNGS